MGSSAGHDDQAGPPTAAPHTPPGETLLAEVRRQVENPETGAVLQRVAEAARSLTESAGAALLLYDRETRLVRPAVPRVTVGLDRRWLRRRGLDAAWMRPGPWLCAPSRRATSPRCATRP